MLNRLLARLRRNGLADRYGHLLRYFDRGWKTAEGWAKPNGTPTPSVPSDNPLRSYFDAHRQGRGIWKWSHYFDAYHRHFGRFRSQEVHVLEIGIYSGGSLEMWREYFGPKCHIYGVDIEPACRAYESESVKVFIGDQSDRAFWQSFRRDVPKLDIVIDDGGHEPGQQIVSFEELLPHLQPGGVYLCEDLHDIQNGFGGYIAGLAPHLNDRRNQREYDEGELRQVIYANAVQASINSVHLYPFMAFLERNQATVAELLSLKHGTEWQPFLK